MQNVITKISGESKFELLVFLVLALIPLVFSGYILFILPQYMLFGLLAVSLSILWGLTGIISFGQAGFFAIGAYAIGIVVKSTFLMNSAILGILLGIIVSAVIAGVVGYFLFSAKVKATYFVLATLALSIIIEQLAKSQKEITGGWNGLFVDRISISFGNLLEYSLFDDIPMYYFTLLLTIIAYALIKFLTTSNFGKILRGIRENEDRILALGYNTSIYKTLIFCVSGALAGFAGSIYGTHAGFVDPSLARVLFSTEVIVWVAIGGRNSIIGSFLGGILVASLANYLNSITPEYWQLIIGIVFIAVVILFKGGLAGGLEEIYHRLKSKNYVSARNP